MSTENVEVFNRYRGNGAATQFSIGFPYLKREYVKVYLFKGATGEEVKLSNNRFSFVNDSTIKFPVLDTDEILQEGDILTIQRETTLGSEFEFDNQRRLFPVEVMNADDLSFQQIQELRREINRSVRVNPTAEETPEELLNTVYDKLDSATAVATDAILAAEQATIAAEKATTAVEAAEKQIEETQEYVDGAKLDIDSTVEAAKQEINTTIDEAQMNLSDTIEQAVEDVKQEAIKAADETIQATIGASVDEAADYARESKAWARGEDAEVEEFAPGEEEHSSRGYADLAMAIANTPEDVPVDTSTLLALDVIRGPKGDSGDAEFSGDVEFEGSFNVHGDDNHPVKVTSLAGATASGYQVVDSNGAGESDFEHAATGDRYITRIANKSTTTGKTVNVDLYQTTAGKSVLDLSKPDTILAPQLLDIIFPIGSYYLSEEDSCPLADWMDGCQWEKVGTSLVSGTTAAVVGNGMTLGLTSGTNDYTLGGRNYGDAKNFIQGLSGNSSGVSLPTTGSSPSTNLVEKELLGVTTDPTKSGIVANLPTITVNIFRRTM